jgi:hypothetical protein
MDFSIFSMNPPLMETMDDARSVPPGRPPASPAATGTIYRMQKNLRFSFTPQGACDPGSRKE